MGLYSSRCEEIVQEEQEEEQEEEEGSPSKGVNWDGINSKWKVYVNYKSKQITVGRFEELGEAKLARRIAQKTKEAIKRIDAKKQ